MTKNKRDDTGKTVLRRWSRIPLALLSTSAFWVILLGLIAFLMLLYSHYSWQHTYKDGMERLQAITNIESNLANGYLWQEELLEGDLYISIDQVWEEFTKIEISLDTLVAGLDRSGNVKQKERTPGTQHHRLFTLRTDFRKFVALAKEGWENRDTSGIGSEFDQRFDDSYLHLQDTVGLLKNDLLEDVEDARVVLQDRAIWYQLVLVILVAISTVFLIRSRRERDKAEGELKRSNENLNRVIAELESFTYSVSHDLRAPIRHIKGLTELLQRNQMFAENAEADHLLKGVTDAARRMSQLVEDLLKLSKIDRTDLNLKDVDITSLAGSVASSLHQKSADRTVEFVIEENLVSRADENLLGIALQNLMENAWKYSRENAEARISVGLLKKDHRQVFYVRDNGIGFDTKYADKIFTAFTRLHSQDRYEGTGIGLSIVKRIIERHGGTIWAESEPEKGTTFYFYLS